MIEKKDLSAEYLDDIVHNAANTIASNTNNGGIKDQINFLITVCGWTEEEILEEVNKKV